MIFTCVDFNPRVGDLEGNAQRILELIRRTDKPEHVLLLPELALTGYSPQDLLLSRPFIRRVETVTRDLLKEVRAGTVILGAPYWDDETKNLYNAALIGQAGTLKKCIKKTLLPNYDIFDEARYFSPGEISPESNTITIVGKKLQLFICEDIWFSHQHNLTKEDAPPFLRRPYAKNPLADSGVGEPPEAIINLSASPYTQKKLTQRIQLAREAVRQKSCPLIYVNQCGANDETLYDGRSFVMNGDGEMVTMSDGFDESLQSIKFSAGKMTLEHQEILSTQDKIEQFKNSSNILTQGSNTLTQPNHQREPLEILFRALVMGVADYARKVGFRQALLGLSGGIDSALTLVIAAAALGAENVLALTMPSMYSSQGSISDSQKLAERLGVSLQKIPITESFTQMEQTLIASGISSPDKELEGLTRENLQSRLRGVILMAYSNAQNKLLLATGNKSELAVGYATLYGDMNGGLAVIGDLFKTEVYALARFLCDHYDGCIPEAILTKAPSAELREEQKDSDSLPPYPVLDAILEMILVDGLGVTEIVARGYDAETVMRIADLIKKSEYKRFQAPPVLKVSERSFGMGRRIPIVKT